MNQDSINQTTPDLEKDLLASTWMKEKVSSDPVYGQNLYAALCNNTFIKNEVWPLLQNKHWSCSWRYAGGIIAAMHGHGDYLDWYCSGIGFFSKGDELAKGYVTEGMVTNAVEQDLYALGWCVEPQV